MLQPVTRASLSIVNPSGCATSANLNSIAFVIPQLPQHVPCHLAIVKMYDAIFQYLVRFMAFSSQNNDISGTRLFERGADGLGAIGLDGVRRVKTAKPH